MKQYSYIFILTGLLLACGSEKQEAELISFEELAGETGFQSKDTVSVGNTRYDQAPLFRTFVQNQVTLFDTSEQLKPHPLDRFGFSYAAKLNFTLKTVENAPAESKSSASVYYYTFSDTVKTKNAFYNWLDCFGKECEALQLNKKLDKLSADPSFTLVYDTTIVAVEYACGDNKNTWKGLQDSLLHTFGKTYKYRLETKCNGPVEWK